MDIVKLLQPPTSYDPTDLNCLLEENDRLRRLLAATARQCNSTKRDLDSAREALGFNNSPFLFLHFPREVRDQIYLYVLQAPIAIQTEPRPIPYLHFDSLQWKPPTPGLCLTNIQIHKEANEVLYGKNMFLFSTPGDMLRFEEQIGSWNRDSVQRIEIMTTRFPAGTMMDPDLVAPCDYSAFPSHWAKAFKRSRLNNIREMVVAREDETPIGDEEAPMLTLDGLRYAIEDVFRRSRKNNFTPKLTLKGFELNEREKFPAHWRITHVAGYFEPTKPFGS